MRITCGRFRCRASQVGLRPIVAIYSTFLQRSYDQVFQEAALQNLPVCFMMDRAGLAGPDGPTHHGVFDIGYMRVFPNMVLMAPADQTEVEPMLEFALQYPGPTGIRYPKATARNFERPKQPIELGKSETLQWGTDGAIIACGAMLEQALDAAKLLHERGIEVAVINARFIKPLDEAMLQQVYQQCRFVVTIEEGALMGGFGSGVMEAVCRLGLEWSRLACLAFLTNSLSMVNEKTCWPALAWTQPVSQPPASNWRNERTTKHSPDLSGIVPRFLVESRRCRLLNATFLANTPRDPKFVQQHPSCNYLHQSLSSYMCR